MRMLRQRRGASLSSSRSDMIQRMHVPITAVAAAADHVTVKSSHVLQYAALRSQRF